MCYTRIVPAGWLCLLFNSQMSAPSTVNWTTSDFSRPLSVRIKTVVSLFLQKYGSVTAFRVQLLI